MVAAYLFGCENKTPEESYSEMTAEEYAEHSRRSQLSNAEYLIEHVEQMDWANAQLIAEYQQERDSLTDTVEELSLIHI
jgi:hypothetical protein